MCWLKSLQVGSHVSILTSMSSPAVAASVGLDSDLPAYAAGLESWLATGPPCLKRAQTPIPDYAERVAAMSELMAVLYDDGWCRYGWPTSAGGFGGTILHRAVMWEALARYGVPGMALYEHLEILAPTLVAMGPPSFVSEAMPEFLAGRQLWAQGFSEPDAGSDLATIRTTAKRDGDGFVINGRKIWTSWARYATWCLVLARTGAADSRHRGLTAFIVDLGSPGVEVRTIEQANGTDELAEVTFDEVAVSADRIVGELDGGWAVAMHILSHERGTFAWFRHGFLYRHLLDAIPLADDADDSALGASLLDLVSVTAAGHAALQAHASDSPLGPKAAYTKLLLCCAEQSVYDSVLGADPDLAIEVSSDDVAVRRQEYLFSRIVTVYGGSQQMQLETIAKQILRLP
jgi:alkylation response protein AidB-like acyl-CoA dehydrogenase